MKFLHLATTLAAAIALVPSFSQNAIALDASYPCFMTTSSGEVIDLSVSICKLEKSPQSTEPAITEDSALGNSAQSDAAFIANYKRSVTNYPDISAKLLASIEESPEANINQAKKVCEQLKAGLSLDEITATHAEENFDKAGVFNASLISSLAPQYYCPELSQQ